MTLLRRVRPVVLSLALSAVFTLAATMCALPAQAGTLQVRDDVHTLSPSDTAHLRSAAAAAPFDVRVVVTSEYADAQALSRYVSSLVTEPNLVVVGLDPEHRRVQVHFGTATQISRSEWPAIEGAGNDAFRRGDWQAGIAAIVGAAARATSREGGYAAPVAVAKPSMAGPLILILLVAGAIGVAVHFARKRSFYGPTGGPGYGAGPYAPGPYGGPGYPMGPGQGGGLGPLGGGLIGAGLGGLAGYELGKLEGERERERGVGGAQEPAEPQRNFDEGGGGSSWDDGGGTGGDGGGFDGGDGGGGSDF